MGWYRLCRGFFANVSVGVMNCVAEEVWNVGLEVNFFFVKF